MQIRFVWAWVLVITGAASTACSSTPKQTGQTTSSTATTEGAAWDAIDAGAVLIDVRTQAEFEEGHLLGALHIPYDEITSRVSELPADKSRPIVLYCRSGRRSGIAKQSLEQLQFTHVINGGGYEALMRARPRR